MGMSRMGGTVLTRSKAGRSEILAVITRADGRVENLGRIAYWHRNPLRRWWGNFIIWLRRH